MALRTVDQYKTRLRDGRVVYFRGERVEDVTTHPVIGVAVDHAAIDYRIAHDPQYRELAVYRDSATGQEHTAQSHPNARSQHRSRPVRFE